YGAIPDDLLDDAQAIQKTINAAAKNKGGVVFFPRGRYLVNTSMSYRKSIQITNSGIVLRGEGASMGGTVIHQVNPFDSGVPASDAKHYHLGESVFTIRSLDEEAPFVSKPNLASLTAYTNADPFSIEVSETENLSVGQNVLLFAQSSEVLVGMLAPYEADPKWEGLLKKPNIAEIHRIKSISGKRLVFFEPLRYAVRVQDNWVLKPFRPITEVGVEDIAFFGNAYHRYVHHRSDIDDSGWAFIKLKGVSDGWIRRCAFIDASQTLTITLSSYVSALDLVIAGNQGHHIPRTVWFTYGVLGGLITDLAHYSHGPSVSQGAVGTVYWRCDLGLKEPIDSHSGRPFLTLFDRINGGSLYGSSGGLADYPQHLKKLVIWNFKGGVKNEDGSPVVYDFWKKDSADMFVNPIISGFHGEKASFNEAHLEVLESPGTPVSPTSLYEAQLALRLGQTPAWIETTSREHAAFVKATLPEHFSRDNASSRPFLVPEKFSVKDFLDFIAARPLQMFGRKFFTPSIGKSDLTLETDQTLLRHAVYAAMVAIYSLSKDGNTVSVNEGPKNNLVFRIASGSKNIPTPIELDKNPDFQDLKIYMSHLKGEASWEKSKDGVSIDIKVGVLNL
ncbi:MAG: DUF4955 domain-containing protein, partial [Spirochaetia bacterium]|nr:DUF4955 domain-containing protein [Spirochaetia bacterium]